jgi:hypothetical protein
MPGAYAHITIVNQARDSHRLETTGVPIPAILAVLRHFKFCELGAVSPDYPYLHLMHKGSKIWADLMHYERTGEPIKRGIELARALHGEDQEIVVAWLMGYAAHVVTDLTIHPVVELRVGAYAENSKAHRVCELHQDAYIFQRMNLDEVGRSEHLDTGIWGCCDAPGSGKLHRTVLSTWLQMLASCHPEQFAENEPEIDAWHAGFKMVVDKAEEGNHMPLLARHVAVSSGLTYPAIGDIDNSYITHLKTPSGSMHYDDLFDKALANVGAMWSLIGKSVFEGDQSYLSKIQNWNLDTGRNAGKMLAYWPKEVTAKPI